MAGTSILALVAAHRVALAANDAAHDAHENRKPDITSEELAPVLAASDACFDAERAAWSALASTPCSSAADVQAKLSYILDSERLCDWIEGGIDDPLGLLRSLRLAGSRPDDAADPLLALIAEYRVGLAIEHGVPDDEWDARREEAAKVWRPSWDRLCSDPPQATSLAGVQAALQLVHDENATGVSVELTANVTRAALAYFGRA